MNTIERKQISRKQKPLKTINCIDTGVRGKGRPKKITDESQLTKISNLYKEMFNINKDIEPKSLSKHDKMILSYHFLSLIYVGTEGIANFLGYPHHTSILYHREVINKFLDNKAILKADFEHKFITFNAYFNKNKSELC